MELFLNAEPSKDKWVYRDSEERLVFSNILGKAGACLSNGCGELGEEITEH